MLAIENWGGKPYISSLFFDNKSNVWYYALEYAMAAREIESEAWEGFVGRMWVIERESVCVGG